MPALQMVSGYVTAPGTSSFTGITLASGDSLTIQAADPTKKNLLLQSWAYVQADGVQRIKSPRLHDNVDGIRMYVNASTIVPLLPMGVPQPVTPQDTLAVDAEGSSTSGDIESHCLLLYYESLPGIAARLITPAQLAQKFDALMGADQALTAGTSGGYSGEQKVNADFDQFVANADYALLGAISDSDLAAVGIRGPDTGNLRVGIPLFSSQPEVSRDWFVRLSNAYGLPLIPVFNAANKALTLVDVVNNENALSPNITLFFARLKP